MPQLHQPHLPNLSMVGSWNELDFLYLDQENMNPLLLNEEPDLVGLGDSPMLTLHWFGFRIQSY
jgi:hypothetical protein